MHSENCCFIKNLSCLIRISSVDVWNTTRKAELTCLLLLKIFISSLGQEKSPPRNRRSAVVCVLSVCNIIIMYIYSNINIVYVGKGGAIISCCHWVRGWVVVCTMSIRQSQNHVKDNFHVIRAYITKRSKKRDGLCGYSRYSRYSKYSILPKVFHTTMHFQRMEIKTAEYCDSFLNVSNVVTDCSVWKNCIESLQQNFLV